MDPITSAYARAGVGVLYWGRFGERDTLAYFSLIHRLIETEPSGRRPFLRRAVTARWRREDPASLEAYRLVLEKSEPLAVDESVQCLLASEVGTVELLAYLVAIAATESGVISYEVYELLLDIGEQLGCKEEVVLRLCFDRVFDDPFCAAVYLNIQLMTEARVLDLEAVERVRRVLEDTELLPATQFELLRLCHQIDTARDTAVSVVADACENNTGDPQRMANLLSAPISTCNTMDLSLQYYQDLLQRKVLPYVGESFAEYLRAASQSDSSYYGKNVVDRDCAQFGLNRNAAWEDIRRAYHYLTNQFHPDRLHSKDLPEDMVAFALRRFKEITAAYGRLRDYYQLPAENRHFDSDVLRTGRHADVA